jgi:hypothetical protein
MSCGISIDDHHYNVHCYADDILLSSATVSGLQRLIDCAVGYITSHGLRFNPAKSSCFSYGKGASATECYIEGQAIPQVEEMVYLGATLRNDSGTAHAERRSNSATKAFYSLQGVGLRLHGLSPDVCAKLFTTGVRTVLSYASEAVHLSSRALKKMESTQGKLIKSFLGLKKWSRTTPLLNALAVPPVAETVGLSSLKLLRSCLLHSSQATHFYLRAIEEGPVIHTLADRAMKYAETKNISVISFLTDNAYFNSKKKLLFPNEPADGLIDSLKNLLSDYNETSRHLVQLLVNSF